MPRAGVVEVCRLGMRCIGRAAGESLHQGFLQLILAQASSTSLALHEHCVHSSTSGFKHALCRNMGVAIMEHISTPSSPAACLSLEQIPDVSEEGIDCPILHSYALACPRWGVSYSPWSYVLKLVPLMILS